jgi:hypothetical protein
VSLKQNCNKAVGFISSGEIDSPLEYEVLRNELQIAQAETLYGIPLVAGLVTAAFTVFFATYLALHRNLPAAFKAKRFQ